MPLFTSPDRKAFIAFGFASESFNFKQEKTIESDKNDPADLHLVEMPFAGWMQGRKSRLIDEKAISTLFTDLMLTKSLSLYERQFLKFRTWTYVFEKTLYSLGLSLLRDMKSKRSWWQEEQKSKFLTEVDANQSFLKLQNGKVWPFSKP